MQQQKRMSPSFVYGSRDIPSIIHYLTLILVIISLAFSVWSFVKIAKIEKAAIPPTADIGKFLKKLTAHDEAREYAGVNPLNVAQITQNNLGNFQAQIAGLDTSYVGSYLVQYANAIIIYDYSKDKIKGKIALQQSAQSMQEAVAKLHTHPEMASLQGEQPQGGQLDAATLATLKQQLPDVYANAKEGDFLFRYSTRIVIYDYANDRIVNTVSLQ